MTDYHFHADGTMSRPTPDELAAVDGTTAVVALVTGAVPDGGRFYAFVAVRPSRYHEFHRLTTARQQVVLSDFGSVLAAGHVAEPGEDVLADIRRRYGYDEALVEKLNAEIDTQRRAHGEAAEAARILDIVRKLKSE